MSNRFWEMLSEEIAFFCFSKQTPNRWPLFFLRHMECMGLKQRGEKEIAGVSLAGWSSKGRNSPRTVPAQQPSTKEANGGLVWEICAAPGLVQVWGEPKQGPEPR